jgi:hypothetical protein
MLIPSTRRLDDFAPAGTGNKMMGPTCRSPSSPYLPRLVDTPANRPPRGTHTGAALSPGQDLGQFLISTLLPPHSDRATPRCFPPSTTPERHPPFPPPRATAGAATPFISSITGEPTLCPSSSSCVAPTLPLSRPCAGGRPPLPTS